MASHALLPLPLLAVLLASASAAAAESAVVDTRRFPRLVHLLLLPEERALLKELKDGKDLREFQKIFWARRDPSPGTAANEFEDNVRAVWKRADELFSYPNQKGSETGCGQVLLLLGRPEELRGPGELTGQTTGARFDNQAFTREGSRQAETWVYRDRPGRPFTFTRAELLIAFDPECRFGEGGILEQDLQRAAATNVVRPDIGYRHGPEGHLVPLSAQLGTAVGALDLLTTPRSDFPLAVEAKLVTRGPKGAPVVAGLVRVPPPADDAAVAKCVSLAFRATHLGNQTVVSGLRESLLATAADGSATASWSLSLKPGRYRVTVAALLPDTGQGSASTIELDMPDLSGSAVLVASPLLLYPDETTTPAPLTVDPRDPYASFQVGQARLRPRFGNVFTPQDALVVVATLFGARVDAATGQASLRSRFTILKDGKPVARGAEDTFTKPDAVASVGPVPLATYAPGEYVVRLDLTDTVASQTLRQEATFEIRRP
jgi:GWxTD domain-containing protein